MHAGDDYSTKPGGPPKADGGTAGGLSKTAQKILNGQKQPPGPTLFFGNLGFQTTEASIKELLEAHRTPNAKKPTEEKSKEEDEEKKVAKKDQWIRKIRMGTFEDTGVCKGYELRLISYKFTNPYQGGLLWTLRTSRTPRLPW